MKRVLLTGAGGYVGRYMIDRLAERGFEVHGVTQQVREADSRLTWHVVDLFDDAATSALCADVSATHLIHLAWETEPGQFWESENNALWQQASESLLESFVRCGGRRAVLAGTCAEYDWSDGHCVAGDTALRAQSAYSRSKLAFRDSALALAEQSDLRVAWARVFFSFGPHERKRRLVPAVTLALLAGERASCTDGEQLRDFMYVPDVADAMTAVADSDFEGDINIAHGEATTIKHLVELIAARLDAIERVDFGAFPRPVNDPPRITADVSDLESIGWAPHHTLDAAIDETIAWWRKQAA
ncbi:MAG: NAD(P)-dependent oxidoreductase [Gammaproteobacteria bacterium]|nr:NAD(P)-dependent oxidoreductase [Gammaproteobacteria bacterium]